MIDGWALIDGAIYAAALFVLTWGGNIFCRSLLSISGITLPPIGSPTAQAAAPAAGITPPASQAAGTTPPTSQAAAPATSAKAGRMIGSLERLIILVGFVTSSWEIMAAVIALKTVGRFKELDDRLHAEYFLIGSLASVVWAAMASLSLVWFDQRLGFDLVGLIRPPTDN